MRTKQDHRGYVLVMTLLLLALAAVALAAVAQESHARAVRAVRAQDELQRRWGALSCQRALLPRAAQVIDAARRRSRQLPGAVTSAARESVQLGRQEYVLLFADEQAKLNINAIANRMDGRRLGEALRRLIPHAATASIRLDPARAREPAADGNTVERLTFASYGQLFDTASPAALSGIAEAGRSTPSALITCWGDGRVNPAVAPRAVVTELAATVLHGGEEARFRKLLQRDAAQDWQDTFKQLNLPPDRSAAMQNLLATQSSCHSLWIVADVAGRRCYQFCVKVDDEPARVFEW
jgi:type II secretory pathway component PulK